jgi:hypothetical protein
VRAASAAQGRLRSGRPEGRLDRRLIRRATLRVFGSRQAEFGRAAAIKCSRLGGFPILSRPRFVGGNPLTLGQGRQWRGAGAPNLAAFRAEQLRAQIPVFFPTNITEISNEALPGVLAQCIKLATESARMSQPNLHFAPVLITSYSDGTPMLTVACAVSEESQDDHFPGAHFARWAFACKGWNDQQTISVPVLSLKEQYKLDANLHRGAKRMLAALKFLPGDDADASMAAIKSYKALNRFYPTFRHIADS